MFFAAVIATPVPTEAETTGTTTLELVWSTSDAGAAASTDGAQILAGSFGQVDSGPKLTGGTWTLDGGFWPALTAVATPPVGDSVFADGFENSP